MTVYQELANLSNEYWARFYADRLECEDFVREFLRGFVDYLNCPPESLQYVKLANDLSFGEPTWTVCNPGVQLIWRDDNFGYFAIEYSFPIAGSGRFERECNLLAITKDGDEFLLKYADEATFRSERNGNYATFYATIVQNMKQNYQLPLIHQPKVFGFAAFGQKKRATGGG